MILSRLTSIIEQTKISVWLGLNSLYGDVAYDILISNISFFDERVQDHSIINRLAISHKVELTVRQDMR